MPSSGSSCACGRGTDVAEVVRRPVGAPRDERQLHPDARKAVQVLGQYETRTIAGGRSIGIYMRGSNVWVGTMRVGARNLWRALKLLTDEGLRISTPIKRRGPYRPRRRRIPPGGIQTSLTASLPDREGGVPPGSHTPGSAGVECA